MNASSTSVLPVVIGSASLLAAAPGARPAGGSATLALGAVVLVPVIVLGTLVLLAVVWVATVYNRLATRRIRVQNGFSQIDVQLRRRHDLIPNLVNTVKGYMEHERSTLEAVTTARAAAVSAQQRVGGAPADAAATMALAQAEGLLQGALGRLFILMERYPEIKANTNALALQEELVSTENRIAFARQAYNDAVMTFNTSLAVFPDNLVAGWFGFAPAALFQADDAQRALPEVRFAAEPPRSS
jgi:LemA protein